jgi:hypothetical protein
MSDVQVFPQDRESVLFSRPEQLINIQLPSDIRTADLTYCLGSPQSSRAGQNWLFVFKGCPMKINGFVLVTYKRYEYQAKLFLQYIRDPLLVEDKKPDDKDKKPNPFQKKDDSKKDIDPKKNPVKEDDKDEDDAKDGEREKKSESDELEYPAKTEVVINPHEKDIDSS